MTDSPPPLSDEDISAALDGQAQPDVVARIADDPAASAQLEAMAFTASAVGTPVAPLSAAEADGLIAHAMTTVGAPATGDAADAGERENPTALASPSGPSRRLPPAWLVAAAVTLVVAVGLALVWSGTRDGTDERAGSGGASSAAGGARSKSSADGSTQLEEAEVTTSAAESNAAESPDDNTSGNGGGDSDAGNVIDLGRFATVEELRSALAGGVPDGAPDDSGAQPDSARLDRCGQQVRITLNGTQEPPPLGPRPDRQGLARVAGREVFVYEFDTTTFQPGTSAVVAAVGVDACDPVLTFVR